METETRHAELNRKRGCWGIRHSTPDLVDEEVSGGSRGQYQGNSVVSRQHELHAPRVERTTVQHETNETHGYSVLLCGQSHPQQNPIFASLSYRGDAGRLLH